MEKLIPKRISPLLIICHLILLSSTPSTTSTASCLHTNEVTSPSEVPEPTLVQKYGDLVVNNHLLMSTSPEMGSTSPLNRKSFHKSSLEGGSSGIFALRRSFRVSNSIPPKGRALGRCPHRVTPQYSTNFEGGCRSYTFCSSGWLTTYLCGVNQRFNGERCVHENEYICPESRSPHGGGCPKSPNGYFTDPEDPQNYFYCYQGVKVIDLSCPQGKIFDGEGCIQGQTLKRSGTGDISNPDDLKNNEKTDSCEGKDNGFFTQTGSGCQKYYFCIGGVKTELECGSGRIFNGDICVNSDDGDFICPDGHSGPQEEVEDDTKGWNLNGDQNTQNTLEITSPF